MPFLCRQNNSSLQHLSLGIIRVKRLYGRSADFLIKGEPDTINKSSGQREQL